MNTGLTRANFSQYIIEFEAKLIEIYTLMILEKTKQKTNQKPIKTYNAFTIQWHWTKIIKHPMLRLPH